MLNNNVLKLIAVTLIVLTLISMAFAKYFLPELDITEINTVLLSLLTGLGVMHVTGSSNSSTQPPENKS